MEWLKYIDLSLAYILDHAVCCASAASSGRSLHLLIFISQLRTKHSSSNCTNLVRRTKSSIKKRIIVRRTVRSMFGEQTVRPVKNGLNALPPGQTGSLLTALNSDAVMYLSQSLGQLPVPNKPCGFCGR